MNVVLGKYSSVFHALEKENDKLCLYPWSGLTVNPDGRISPCCHMPMQTLSHISEIESLNDFFNESQKIDNMRKAFKQKTIPCLACKNRYGGGFIPSFKRRNPNLPFDEDNYFNRKKKVIRYLEFTPSNLCNQACAMCGSKYSSMWDSIDKIAIQNDELKFRYNDTTNHRTALGGKWNMTDEDYNKIIQCIKEGVTVLHIKGGEPFADERNIELLERVDDFPHLMWICITTNFKRVNKRIINLIRKIKDRGIKLSVNISIDGVGKQYEWIRSSPWEKLVSNINQTVKEIPSFRYSIGVTQSIYNFFNMIEQFEEFSKLPNVGNILGRACINPAYLHHNFVLDRKTVEDYKALYKNKIVNNKKYCDNDKSNDWLYYDPPHWKKATKKDTWESDFKQHRKNLEEFTDFMNRIRGFNIEDINPQFKKFINGDTKY